MAACRPAAWWPPPRSSWLWSLGGGANAPSVLATASLATGGPVLPAPAEDSANGAVLKASMGGVPFPYWGDSFQWEAVGARDDKIEDRSAKTVFYDNPKGARAAYTILGGDTIDAPSGARKLTRNGTSCGSPRTTAGGS